MNFEQFMKISNRSKNHLISWRFELATQQFDSFWICIVDKRKLNKIYENKTCLRGGGCRISSQQDEDKAQIIINEDISPAISDDFISQLKQVVKIIADNASQIADRQTLETTMIAVQWLIYNRESFSIVGSKPLIQTYFKIISDSFQSLMEASVTYIKTSNLLCLQLLSICTNMAKNLYDYFYFNDLIQDFNKQNILNIIAQLKQQSQNMSQAWTTCFEYEIIILQASIRLYPSNQSEVDEIKEQFFRGLVKSVFQASISDNLIDCLISSISLLIQTGLQKYQEFVSKEIFRQYYLFDELKWTLIKQLRNNFTIKSILDTLNKVFTSSVEKSNSWITHYQWMKLLSDILIERPLINSNLPYFQRNTQSWSNFIDYQLLQPLQQNNNQAVLFYYQNSDKNHLNSEYYELCSQFGLKNSFRFFKFILEGVPYYNLKYLDSYVNFQGEFNTQKLLADQYLDDIVSEILETQSIEIIQLILIKIKGFQTNFEVAQRMIQDNLKQFLELQSQSQVTEMYLEDLFDNTDNLKNYYIKFIKAAFKLQCQFKFINFQYHILKQLLNKRGALDTILSDIGNSCQQIIKQNQFEQQILDNWLSVNNIVSKFYCYIFEVKEILLENKPNLKLLSETLNSWIQLSKSNTLSFQIIVTNFQNSYEQLKLLQKKYQSQLRKFKNTKEFSIELFSNEDDQFNFNEINQYFNLHQDSGLILFLKNITDQIQSNVNTDSKLKRNFELENNVTLAKSLIKIQIKQVNKIEILFFDFLESLNHIQKIIVEQQFILSEISNYHGQDQKQINNEIKISGQEKKTSDLELTLLKTDNLKIHLSQQQQNTQIDFNQEFKNYIIKLFNQHSSERKMDEKKYITFENEVLQEIQENFIKFLDGLKICKPNQLSNQILTFLNHFQKTINLIISLQKVSEFERNIQISYKDLDQHLALTQVQVKVSQQLRNLDLQKDNQVLSSLSNIIINENENLTKQIPQLIESIYKNFSIQSFKLQGMNKVCQCILLNQLIKPIFQSQNKNTQNTSQIQKSAGIKSRECLIYLLIKMANQSKEQFVISYSQNLLLECWMNEKDQSVKNFIKNKEMIDFQKNLFSKDLKSINSKLKDQVKVKLIEITELENKLKQEISIFIREQKREEIEKKYNQLENFIINIQDMSQKMDLAFPFLIEIRKDLSLIKQKVDNLQRTVNDIARDIKLLRGKSFQNLLDIRKNSVLQNKKLNDLQNIYIPMFCLEIDPITGKKQTNRTHIFIEKQNNFDAEVNEFLWKEQSKKDVLLIHGIAGSGKSTLARKIEEFLWGIHDWNNSESVVPIFISLPLLEDPKFNLVDQILQSDIYQFDRIQIQEFKTSISNNNHKLIFIIDGYDELNSKYIQQNLYNTNRIEKNWKDSRLIYTTRSEVLIQNLYQQWFKGKKDYFLKEVELQPFTEEEQKQYVQEFSILNLKLKILQFVQDTHKMEQKIMNYYLFEQLWKQIKQQEIQENNLNLLHKDHVQKIIMIVQNYVKDFCQLQFVELLINLEKEIGELWSSKKFESSINFLGLRPLLISPFMLQIVVQVLPNTAAYYSQINRIKEHFIQKFIELKQTQQMILSYKNQSIKTKQNMNANHNQLSIQANKQWEILEEQEYFKDFSILNQIKLPQGFNQEDQDLVYMAIKQQDLKMYDFYVAFVQFYQNNQIKKLSEQGKIQDEENFRKELNLFQQALALDMTQNQLALVNYQKKGKLRLDEDNSEVDNNDSWMDKYFDDSNEGKDKKLLRKGSLLNQKGNTFSFMHKSIQEYFVSLYLIDFLHFLPQIDFDKVSELFDKLIQQIKNNGKIKFNTLNALIENIKLNFKQEIHNLPNLIQFLKIIGKSKFSNLNFSLQSYYGIQKFIIHEIRMKQQSEVKLLLITRLSSLLFDFLRISSNGLYLFTQIFGVINQINLELIDIEGINIQGCSCYKVNLNGTQFQNVNISQCAFNASKMQSVNWNQLICSEQPKFDGHEDDVWSLVFSPDGKILISGSFDETIRLWDVNAEKQLLRLESNHGYVSGVAFSPDGLLWASVHGQDGVVMLWKINQIVAVKEFSEHKGEVCSVAFSHDSKILVSGGIDKLIFLYDIVSLEAICSLNGHENSIWTLVFSQNINILASGGADKVIRIWDIHERKEIIQLQGHTGWVRSLSFHPNNNNILASGSHDQTIRIWDIDRGIIIIKIDQGIGEIYSVQFSPDGNTLASGGKDQTIRLWLWDTSALKEIQKFEGHTSSVVCVIFSPDGQTLASGSNDKSIRLWNVHGGRNIQQLNGHSNGVICIQVSPDGRFIASGSVDQLIKFWDLKGGIEIRRFIGHTKWVKTLCFSQNGQYLLSGGGDEIVILWDVNSSQEIRRFIGHQYEIVNMKMSPDQQIIASCDYKIIIWDLQNSENYRCQLNGHTDLIWSLEFSPDGQLLVSGGGDNLIKIWDWKQQIEVYQLNGHTNELRSVIFFSNGLRLASCSKDKTIRLWDIKQQKELYKLIGHTERVIEIKLTNNEQQLVSCSADLTIRFWNLINQQEILRILTHTDAIQRVILSPNQKQLISCSYDNSIKLWDIDGHKGYQSDIGHTNEITYIVFSPDGQKLGSCSKDKTIRVYHIKEKKQILKLEGHKDQVFQIIFTSNQLISCSQDKTIKLWDIIRGHEINSKYLDSFARCIDISFDQRYLACGCNDGSIFIWDISDSSNINQKFKMPGHTKMITSIVFSPKEDILVSGSYDQQIKLWNYHTGLELKKLKRNLEFIQKIIFSPNGQNIVIICQDEFIRIWNTQTEDSIVTLKGHNDVVFSLAFSEFGLISGSKDKSIRLWNIELAIEVFKQHLDNEIIYLAYNHQQKYLAYITNDQSIAIGESYVCEKGILKEHKDLVNSVSFSPDGSRLASCCMHENLIIIWNVKTQKKISSLDAEQVWDIQFMPNGKQIVSGGWDNIIRLFDLEMNQQIKTFTQHSNQVWSIDISLDGSTIVSGSLDKSVIFWKVENENNLQIKTQSDVFVVKYSTQQQFLAVGMANSEIIILNSGTKLEKQRLNCRDQQIITLEFSSDDLILASGSITIIVLWNLQNGQIISQLNGHSKFIWSVQFQPNQKIIASCSSDKTIRFWNLNVQKYDEFIKLEQDEGVFRIAFSPDGKMLASGNKSQNVKLWNCNLFSEYHTFFSNKSQKALVSLSADEQMMAIEYIDGSVRIFDISEDKQIQIILLQNLEILSLCLSPNGDKLATGFRNDCIRIWNTIDKQEKVVNISDVSSLIYSSDGSILAASTHQMIILFNCENWSENKRLQGHTDYIISLSFSQDNKQLLSNSKDNSLRIWLVQTGELKQLIFTSLINVNLAFFKENNMDRIIINNFEDQPREIILSTSEEIGAIKLTKRDMLQAYPYNHPINIKNGIGCYKTIARQLNLQAKQSMIHNSKFISTKEQSLEQLFLQRGAII